VLFRSRPYVDAVPFYSRGRIATVSLENQPLTAATLAAQRTGGRDPGRLLHLTGGAGLLWGQYEGPLLARLNAGRVRAVLFTFGPYTMRSGWFRTHPDLRLVRSLGGGTLQIYRVMRRPIGPNPRAGTRIGTELFQQLRSASRRGPAARAALERTLGEVLGWPPAQVREMTDLAAAGRRLEFEERYTKGPVR
jgi:hypothetical protein